VPSDIRSAGGVARMSDPALIEEIKATVTIPVMAKARIGHFAEAQILQAIGVDYIDESEVLTPADDRYHIDKNVFTVPFVCGARDLGEALRRIGEGAAMIRTKGEAGSGNIVEAVRHMRAMVDGIRWVQSLSKEQLMAAAKELQSPFELVQYVHENGRLPVVNFCAGGVATPADASLMMQLGADGIFVGSGVFKSGDPEKRARAIVEATTHFEDPAVVAEASKGLGEAMRGIEISQIPERELLATRGW
jgi:pyridoxal 5'-phosphate synthase pdxS subunit